MLIRGEEYRAAVRGKNMFYGPYLRRIDQAQGLVESTLYTSGECGLVATQDPSCAVPCLVSVRIPNSSLLSPAPGSNFRRSTAVFLSSRNDTFELRHYLKPSRTGTRLSRNKLSEICRVHAPRAPHPPRHRMADTTRHQDNTRVVEPASQPASLRRHIPKGRMKSHP